MKTAFVAAALSAFAAIASGAALPEPVAEAVAAPVAEAIAEPVAQEDFQAAAAPLATLWADANFLPRGQGFDITARGRCIDLPSRINNKMSSYKIFAHVNCAFWDKGGCSANGQRALFDRDGPVQIGQVKHEFNDRVGSVKCS